MGTAMRVVASSIKNTVTKSVPARQYTSLNEKKRDKELAENLFFARYREASVSAHASVSKYHTTTASHG